MDRKFSGQLDAFIKQAGLSLRRAAGLSGIPHQTIFNWLKGSQPRQYTTLPGDLHRLGDALGLAEDEITLLLQLAGCIPARSGLDEVLEVPMESSYRMPKGWEDTGDGLGSYVMGVDPDITYENHPCVTIKAGPEPNEFAAMAQRIKADTYQGKRLRFSAALRSEEVENRTALFMRVDGPNGKMLAFDNMRDRAITGTNDWTHYAIVLDVAEDAMGIVFGILLSLKGQVWMSDVHLDEVGHDVPTTDILEEIQAYFPVNLDFED